MDHVLSMLNKVPTTRWLCESFPQRSFRVRGNPHLLAHPTTHLSFRCKFSSQEEKEFLCVCKAAETETDLTKGVPVLFLVKGMSQLSRNRRDTPILPNTAGQCNLPPSPLPLPAPSPPQRQLLHSQRSAGNHPRWNLPQGLLRARSRAGLNEWPSDQLDETLTKQSTIRRCGVTEALPLNCLHPFQALSS